MERIARTGAVKVQRRNSNFFKPIFLDFTYSVFSPPLIVLTALYWCFFPGSFLIIFGSKGWANLPEPKPKPNPIIIALLANLLGPIKSWEFPTPSAH